MIKLTLLMFFDIAWTLCTLWHFGPKSNLGSVMNSAIFLFFISLWFTRQGRPGYKEELLPLYIPGFHWRPGHIEEMDHKEKFPHYNTNQMKLPGADCHQKLMEILGQSWWDPDADTEWWRLWQQEEKWMLNSRKMLLKIVMIAKRAREHSRKYANLKNLQR